MVATSKSTKKSSDDPRQMIAEAREEIKSTNACILLSIMDQLEELTRKADDISEKAGDKEKEHTEIRECTKKILETATGDALDHKLKTILVEDESAKNDWPDLDLKLEKILEDTAMAYKLADYEKLDGSHKNCLLCLAIFPQDAIIQKRTLIYWWIGEGFVNATADKTAEDVGEDSFQKLLNDNWINAINNKNGQNVREFKMDPWVRWLVIYRARKDNFFNLDETGMPYSFPSKCCRHCLLNKPPPNLEQKGSSHGGINPSNQEDSTRPSLEKRNLSNQEGSTISCFGKRNSSNQEGSTGERNPSNQQSSTKVYSKILSVFNVNAERLRAQDLFPTFKEMKSLLVMHLGRWQTSTEAAKRHIEFEDEEIELLESMHKLSLPKRLRYLSFAGISRITELPTSVKKLSHLKILDLRSCQNLEKLGEEIKFLKSLTHLDVSECYMLDHMPKGLGTLSQLEVLKGFIFGTLRSKDSCQLAELTKLKRLRKLSISIGSEAQIQPNEMTKLKEINGLHSLAITWALTLSEDDKKTPKEDWTDLGSYFPPGLEKLDLRCFPDKTVWLDQNLKSLKKLYIRGGQVQDIKTKTELDLQMDVEMIRLKFLKMLFKKWSELEKWFPHLNYLEIHKCPNLDGFPELDKHNVWMKEPMSATLSTDTITTTDVSVNPLINPSPSEGPAVPPATGDIPTSTDTSVGSQTGEADGATTTSGPPIETPTSIPLPTSTSKTPKSSSLDTTEVVGPPDIPDRAPILTDNTSRTTNITSSSPPPAAPSGLAHSTSTTTSSSLATSTAVVPSAIPDNPSCISTNISTPAPSIQSEDTILTTTSNTSSQTPPHPTSPTTDAAHDTPTPTDPSNSLSSRDKGHVAADNTSITPTSSPVAQNNASISASMSARDRDTSAAATAHDTHTPTNPSNSLSSLDKGRDVADSTSLTPTSSSPVALNNASISATLSARDQDTSADSIDTVVTHPPGDEPVLASTHIDSLRTAPTATKEAPDICPPLPTMTDSTVSTTVSKTVSAPYTAKDLSPESLSATANGTTASPA